MGYVCGNVGIDKQAQKTMREHLQNHNPETTPMLSAEAQHDLDNFFGANTGELRSNYRMDDEGTAAHVSKPRHAKEYNEALDTQRRDEDLRRKQQLIEDGHDVKPLEGLGRHRGDKHASDFLLTAQTTEEPPRRRKEDQEPTTPGTKTARNESVAVQHLSTEEASRRGMTPRRAGGPNVRVDSSPTAIPAIRAHIPQAIMSEFTPVPAEAESTPVVVAPEAEPSNDTSLVVPETEPTSAPASPEYPVQLYVPAEIANNDEPTAPIPRSEPRAVAEGSRAPESEPAAPAEPTTVEPHSDVSEWSFGDPYDFEPTSTPSSEPEAARIDDTESAQPDNPPAEPEHRGPFDEDWVSRPVSPVAPETTAPPRTVSEMITAHGWAVQEVADGEWFVMKGPESDAEILAAYNPDDPEATPRIHEALDFMSLAYNDPEALNQLSSEQLAEYKSALAENVGIAYDKDSNTLTDSSGHALAVAPLGIDNKEEMSYFLGALDRLEEGEGEGEVAAATPDASVIPPKPSTPPDVPKPNADPNTTLVAPSGGVPRQPAARPFRDGLKQELARIFRIQQAVTPEQKRTRRRTLVGIAAVGLAANLGIIGYGIMNDANETTVSNDRGSVSATPTPGPTETGNGLFPLPSIGDLFPSGLPTGEAAKPTTPTAPEKSETPAKPDRTDDTNRVELPKDINTDSESIRFTTKDGKTRVTATVKKGGTASDAIFDSLQAADAAKLKLENPSNLAATYDVVSQLAERGVNVDDIPVGQEFSLQIDPVTGKVTAIG